MNTNENSTPDGDPIDTFTMWLDFGDEGETAISLDFTKFNAAMRRIHPVQTKHQS